MVTPAEEAVMIQDTAADRLVVAWSTALATARTSTPEPTSTPPEPGVVPPGLESMVRLALLSAAVVAVSSSDRRDDTPSGPAREREPKRPDQARLAELVDEIAPSHAEFVWKAAHEHAASSPRGTDPSFVRHAAWTDGANAAAEVQLGLAEELGLPFKIWLTRGDDDVRAAHRKLHGNVTKIKTPFRKWPNGKVLAYPGDHRAPMDMWINCRCFMFLSPTDDYVAEAFMPADLDKAFALAASLEAQFMEVLV